jgi:hypothetical protein
MIVTLRREKPTWGARKLRERLLRKLPNGFSTMANGTRVTIPLIPQHELARELLHRIYTVIKETRVCT